MQRSAIAMSDNTSSSAAITGRFSHPCHTCHAASFSFWRYHILSCQRQRTHRGGCSAFTDEEGNAISISPITAVRAAFSISATLHLIRWPSLAGTTLRQARAGLAQSVLTNINGFVAAIYYVVAGLGWVLPAIPLISWMARPDNA